ncbi:unnamed protein product, partial [marine sediment metagenome]
MIETIAIAMAAVTTLRVVSMCWLLDQPKDPTVGKAAAFVITGPADFGTIPFRAAVIHAVANEYLERPTTVVASMRTALRVFVPLVWTSFLMYIIIYLGLLAFIIPGIYFSFRYTLCSNIVVIERISGVAALRRSRDLMLSNRTRHYNTAFLLFLLLVVIQFGITRSVANLIPEGYLSMVVSILLQA